LAGSTILTNSAEKDFVLDSLSEQKRPTKVTLLFRASEHSFEATKFHQKCDNIENTLTLVRTDRNRTIAGYTPLKWNTTDGHYGADPEKQSFLLSINMREKMELVDEQRAIFCSKGDGPVFGEGYDLCIRDPANKQKEASYARFPWSYNNLENQYEKDQEAVRVRFCGSPDAKFQVI
jgi:hypothetical protein